MYTINVQTANRSERRVDVHSIVATLALLLDIQADIIRPWHASVQTAARNLFQSGKITIPVQDQQLDLLLRILAYTKMSKSWPA